MHYLLCDTRNPSIFGASDNSEFSRTSTLGRSSSTWLNAALLDTRDYMRTTKINVTVFLKTLLIAYSLSGVLRDSSYRPEMAGRAEHWYTHTDKHNGARDRFSVSGHYA